MAVPFNLPSDDEPEDIYRRLNQILLDLHDLLRQILLEQRLFRQPRPSEVQPQEANNPVGRDEEARVVLPDVVPSAMSLMKKLTPVPPPRRRRRRQDKSSNRSNNHHHHQDQQSAQQASHSLLILGFEFRQISECFNYQTKRGVEKKRNERKALGLFSLLVPAPITGSIWTTVIIIVGWRILSRQR